MYSFRRVALRAFSVQPATAASSLHCRPALHSFSRQIGPLSYRSFHQTRIWASGELKDNIPSSATQAEHGEQKPNREVVEPRIGTPEFADAVEQSSSTQSTTEAVTEKAQELASAARNAVHRVAARTPLVNSQHVSSSPSTLFVGNIFFDATSEQLKEEFSQYGEVVRAQIITDQRGLSKGFGFVQFVNVEDAQRALQEQNLKPFQGRELNVRIHDGGNNFTRRGARPVDPSRRPSAPSGPTNTLFIGNMSYQMSDRDLNDLFRDVTDVVDVRVAIDRRSGQPRGFAHADFIDIAAAERAKAHLEQKVIYGRQLRIDFTESAPRNRQTLTPSSTTP